MRLYETDKRDFPTKKITAPSETMISSFPYLLSKNALYARYVS